MGTRTVADTLRYLVDPWANQSVVFTLLSPIASVDGLYLPRSLTATTDVTGAFSIALPVPDDADEAGTYTCLLPNGQTIPFPLSAGVGSVRLGSLFVEAISTASPNNLQVLIDNHAAVKASTTVSGHVTVDGTTITAANGVLSATGSGGGAPTDATYVALSTNATLTGERVLTAGSNITLTDNGAGGTVVVAAPAVATNAALATEVSARASADSALDTRVDALELAPPAHAGSHASGGGDAVTLAQSQITSLVSDLAAKAPLASPALTGVPTAPTAAAGASTTQMATTAFVASSQGSTSNTFSLGDGTAGAKVLRFLAAGAGDISWTPTAARTITLPDASGTLPLLGTANTFSATNTFSGTVNIGTGASLSYGATFDADGLILRPNLALAGARIYCYTNGNSLLSPFVLVNENAGTSAGAGLVIAAGSTFIGGLVSQLIGSALNSRTVLRVLSNGSLTANDATGVFFIEGATTGPFSVLRAPLSVIPVSTTATTSAVPTLTLDANTSAGTPGTGFGASLLMLGRSSTTASQSMATWETTWATATHASRKARTVGTVFDTASREWIRGEASGTAAMVGFLGASATAREAVVANATDLASAIALVNDLKAKLITKGLIS